VSQNRSDLMSLRSWANARPRKAGPGSKRCLDVAPGKATLRAGRKPESAALVPKPRVNLTRFHGVLAPNSTHRVQVTPAQRSKGKKTKAPDQLQDQTPAERRASMTWAQRLKRVFNIDIETCRECGGAVKVIACIEDPVVIEKILTHLNGKAASAEMGLLPASRAPP
jgi:hypothetical protein